MNFNDLSTYRLSDAVKFHNQLNPLLWAADEHLHPQVHQKLLEIADDFREFLGVADLDLVDITISGSNAAYSYTDHSDIDLHLVVRMPKTHSEVYQELFNAKKFQYNDIHNIKVKGADVELYVQDASQPPVSQGEYSIKDRKWIQVPRRRRAEVDHTGVKNKFDDLKARIQAALDSKNIDTISSLTSKLKHMRTTGLDQHGEFGVENLAYKMLRTQGLIGQLYQAQAAARDQALSLAERKKKKKKAKKVKYGYVGHWSMDYGNQAAADGGGVEESTDSNDADVQRFIEYAVDQLGIQQRPEIQLHHDSQWSQDKKTFGRYDVETNVLHVNMLGRHVMDILRTVAHELMHCRQNEQRALPGHAGATGSPWENQTNAQAGVLMRQWAQKNPNLFDTGAVQESSGYIPTAAQKNDPRFKTALTVDVRPGAVGLNANRLGLKTNAAGEPTLLIKNLRNALREFKETNQPVDLLEVRMNPQFLQREASSIEAVAGMEFEMIVPIALGNYDPDVDPEPDYDYDRRPVDIDDVVAFFDENDMNSTRSLRELRNNLTDEYQEWRDDEITRDWISDHRELIRDYITENNEFEEDDARRQAVSEITDANPDLDTNSNDYAQLVNQRVTEMFDEFVQAAVDQESYQGDRIYQAAQDQHRDNVIDDYSESEWMADNYRRMSDIQDSFRIEWPHMTEVDVGDRTQQLRDLAKSFMKAMGHSKVAVGESYHSNYYKYTGGDWVGVGNHKPTDCYTIEPDGSLEADDEGSETGLEFVSPPMPIEQMAQDLKKVQTWAKKYGCYTNESTGLHMNVSIPNFRKEHLDYTKLALLVGDRHILNKFERESNAYAKSAFGKIVKITADRSDEVIADLLSKVKNGLATLAGQALHGTQTDKYTSINTKDRYIEFRSPGGDYLNRAPEELINTMNRFAVAMAAAVDPEAYKKEYATKLYKVLNPAGQKDTYGDMIQEFTNYATAVGGASAATLKQFRTRAASYLKAQRLERENDPYSRHVWRVTSEPQSRYPSSIEVVASTSSVALQTAAEHWGVAVSQLKSTAEVVWLRPYTEPPTGSADGKWGVYLTTVNRFIMATDSNQPRRFNTRVQAQAWLADFNRRRGATAGAQVMIIPDDQLATSSADGKWGIYIIGIERFANKRGTSELNRFSTKEEAERFLADYRATNIGVRNDLEVREIPADVDQSTSREQRWQEYRVYLADRPEVAVGTFIGTPDPHDTRTRTAFMSFLSSIGRSSPAGYGYEAIPTRPARAPQSPVPQSDQQATGPRPWYVSLIGQPDTEIEIRSAANAEEATQQAQIARPGVFGAEAGNIRAARVPVGQVAAPQPPARNPGEFTGEWRIVNPSGQEVHRFGGVGNVQADANRVAMSWLQRHPEHMISGTEVVPVMSE